MTDHLTPPADLDPPAESALDALSIALPGFIRKRDDGLFVDLAVLDSNALFDTFVSRVFSAGCRFEQLDYGLMQRLLYDWAPADINEWVEARENASETTELKLANGLALFPPERRALYRGLKLSSSGNAAEYLFEPLYLETEVEEPVFGEPQEDGELPIVGYNRHTLSDRVYLDLDEFIAIAWEKRLHYGLDVERVREEIEKDKHGARTAGVTVQVAERQAPGASIDATLIEETEALHRNDAPKILSDGRVDLCQFTNRFPQVRAGQKLLRKEPRRLGTVGHDIFGKELEPNLPKDFSIHDMAGPGTRVVTEDGHEYIESVMDGFLNLDTKTNQISVTEKIINKEGVSVRTTGDLSLQGEEFEEHGEVQERRSVKGRNMTFFADVYGEVVSSGGRIVIKQTLAGGKAISDRGVVIVEGNATRAQIEARSGQIEVALAESCVIVGRTVKVGRAVNCLVVADEVEIGVSEGCAIGATHVHIEKSAVRQSQETAVCILVPDLAGFNTLKERLEQQIAERTVLIDKLQAEIGQFGAQPEVKTFITVQKKLKAGEISMSGEQEAQFARLSTKVAPVMRAIASHRARIEAQKAEQAALQAQIEQARQRLAEATASIACEIDQVVSDTFVRTLKRASDENPLLLLNNRDLQIRLREHGAGSTSVFSGGSGEVHWHYSAQ